MASTDTTGKFFNALDGAKQNTLISQGLTLNMRSINTRLSEMFRLYQMVLGRILGSGLIGKSQVKYTYDDSTGTYKEYDKGQIEFKNGIDKLKYLLEHKEQAAKVIGVSPYDIYSSRRDLAKVKENLTKLQSKCELGDYSIPMQMYISRHDNNIGGLDSEMDWTAYILQHEWIEGLVDAVASGIQTGKSIPYSVEYLSDILGGMMKDHEVDYHRNLAEFNADEYLDNGRVIETVVDEDGTKTKIAKVVDEQADAVNMLNSMGRLNYGFYEIYKPIGGGNGKYIKVKMNTDGTVDVSGVAALSDMEHWEWEYGSPEYLRSLNTGNQRYLLKLSIPWNDLNANNPKGSNLWWKPDKPEELKPLFQDDEEEDDEEENEKQYRYYKPYETERFLRWFGTTYVPILDVDAIQKCTVCSAPHLSNDTQSDAFHKDATNIAANGMDLSRANIDESTSQSLLSLQPKSTIRVVNMMDDDHQGQYLEFVVTGHRQTSVLSFNVKGKVYNSIQEMNHYSKTWEGLLDLYEKVSCDILFIDVCKNVIGSLQEDWRKKNNNPEQKVVPEHCESLLKTITSLKNDANQIDLLRLRQIDTQAVLEWFQSQIESIKSFIWRTYNDTTYGYEDIYSYITKYRSPDRKSDIKLSEDAKRELDRQLAMIYDDVSQTELLTPEEIAEMQARMDRYSISYDSVTVDDLRDSITTFCNLVVRLPVDTMQNCATSKRIFRDWWDFFDKASHYLVEQKQLYVYYDDAEGHVGDWKKQQGLGSDLEEHYFTELYVDAAREIPLVDYSWLYDLSEQDGPDRPYRDDEGKPIGDRWDYWTEDDFNWPQ